jgi:arabinan endo-1,5-alpha-L-arabinosidase
MRCWQRSLVISATGSSSCPSASTAPRPLVETDAGHGMIFRAFDGRLLVTVHTPNGTPDERPVFLEVKEQDGMLVRRLTSRPSAVILEP